jgi:hypothetical protein
MAQFTDSPPPFGHQLRQYFGFEADYVNLNNGQPTPTIQSQHSTRTTVRLMFFLVQAPTAPCQSQCLLLPRPLSSLWKGMSTDSSNYMFPSTSLLPDIAWPRSSALDLTKSFSFRIPRTDSTPFLETSCGIRRISSSQVGGDLPICTYTHPMPRLACSNDNL